MKTQEKPSRMWVGMAACLASLLFSGPLAAAGLYRCSGVEGLTFSDRPCGADAQRVSKAAQPSAERVQAAQQSLQRERALAGQLRSHRVEREVLASGGAAGILQSPPGLDSSQRMPVAAPAATSVRADQRQRKGDRTASHKAGARKDPRITFEVKLPAPPRNTGKAVRTKGAP
jgi:Domain of unknown function (DUF4124)